MKTDTIIVSLDLEPAQQAALDATLEAFAHACDHAAAVGRRLETTSNAVIHRFCYRQLRETFGLSANLAVRAIACAARRLKGVPGCAKGTAEVEYDTRTLSLGDDGRTASLSTIAGRLRDIRLHLGAQEHRRLTAGRLFRAVLIRSQPGHYVLAISLVPRP